MRPRVCFPIHNPPSDSEYTANNRLVYVQAFDATSHETVTTQIPSIKSLCGKAVSTINIIDASASRPAGCVVFPVSAAAVVYLRVSGRVDIDAEIAKANKKLEKTRQGVQKQRKILDDPNYKTKVSEELQEVERKRLRDLEQEERGFEETIRQFEQLRLE
jgi:valyl-tRNA synthetase